jgi:hypothetical protein
MIGTIQEAVTSHCRPTQNGQILIATVRAVRTRKGAEMIPICESCQEAYERVHREDRRFPPGIGGMVALLDAPYNGRNGEDRPSDCRLITMLTYREKPRGKAF